MHHVTKYYLRKEDREMGFQISRRWLKGVGLGAKTCTFSQCKQRKWEKVGHSMGDLIIKAFRLRKKKKKIIEQMPDVGVPGYQATQL